MRNEESGDAPDFWERSRNATDLIANQAAMFRLLVLEELLEGYGRADSVGAILDPTGFIKHGKSITTARRIVAAAVQFEQEVAAAIRESGTRG